MYFTDPLLSQLLDEAKAVIFDLNGLIVDDEGVQLAATNQMLKPFGVQLSEEYWILKCVGRRATEFLGEVFAENHVNAGLQESIRKKNDFYRQMMWQRAILLERQGFHYLLYALESKPLGLVTSATADEVEVIMGPRGLNILDRFSAIVCGREAARGKPYPDAYLIAAGKLNVPPLQCLVFEDSAVGVNAAKAAGMKVIAVPNRFTAGQDFSQATEVIPSMKENAVPLSR